MNRGANFAIYRGDPLLLVLGAVLVGIGLIAIASASIEYSEFHFNNPWHHTERHALYLLAGLTAGRLAYIIAAVFPVGLGGQQIVRQFLTKRMSLKTAATTSKTARKIRPPT